MRIWAHPHGCGEHLPRHCQYQRHWGLIPTGVGNTGLRRHRRGCQWAHPHGCGEHLVTRVGVYLRAGSSPRVWGTPQVTKHSDASTRLIPTGVGNTLLCSLVWVTGWAHPHGCGEHIKAVVPIIGAVGSSPRVWGTLGKPTESATVPGLIPTGVGNTVEAF